jgi:membrane protein DedA with SNARE-associated domain
MHTLHHMMHVYGYHLLHAYGYPAITFMLALECAGLIVPGETLMLAAALLASRGHLNIWLVLAAAGTGAMIGCVAGFSIGRWLGHGVLAKYGARIGLTERRLALGRYLFACHGGKMVFFGRFGTGLRSFSPILAGANDMATRPFLLWSLAGAIAWPSLHCFTVFLMGKAAERLSGPASVLFGISALAAIVVVLWLAKRSEGRLTEAALRWQHHHESA